MVAVGALSTAAAAAVLVLVLVLLVVVVTDRQEARSAWMVAPCESSAGDPISE